jgi:hypothetical protein
LVLGRPRTEKLLEDRQLSAVILPKFLELELLLKPLVLCAKLPLSELSPLVLGQASGLELVKLFTEGFDGLVFASDDPLKPSNPLIDLSGEGGGEIHLDLLDLRRHDAGLRAGGFRAH